MLEVTHAQIKALVFTIGRADCWVRTWSREGSKDREDYEKMLKDAKKLVSELRRFKKDQKK